MNPKLVLVAGAPGSGKTFVGKQLAMGSAVLVDKDTVSILFTEAMLPLLGSHPDDRESERYLTRIRNLEYAAMMHQAFENLELGHSVVCVAPFVRELTDAAWLRDLSENLTRMDVSLIKIWVHTDPTT